MLAVTFNAFGGPEVLHLAERPDLPPGAGEVSIAVVAATINPTDLMMRRGEQAKLMTHLTPPYVAGMEFSGHVVAVGSGVDLAPGQAVIGVVNPRRAAGGAQAQRICVPAASVAAVPAGIDLVGAATLPMNALTAMLALDMLGLAPGQSLLVTGGAGQLGNCAIQLGRHAGLTVLANAKDADRPALMQAGAHHVLPRDDGMDAALRAVCPEGVDGLIDGALIGAAVSHMVRAGGGAVSLRASHPINDPRLTCGYVSVVSGMENTTKIRRIADLLAQGALVPRVAAGGVFPLTKAVEATRMAERADFRGRVVLTFAD